MKNAQHLDSIQEATGALISSLESLRNPDNKKEDEDIYELTDNGMILYALGGE